MAILFRSSVDSARRWSAALGEIFPGLDMRFWPDIGNPADIEYALVWKPPPGMLASLPNLKLILSLGAGVDHIFGDPQLPAHVPVVRLVDPHLVAAMSEYIVLHVMKLHRRDLEYTAQQRRREWKELDQVNADDRRVSILGLGMIGGDAARKLQALGFQVAGWSRRPKDVPGIESFHGDDGLEKMLARTDILVCVLPLTPDTDGILSARLFAMLPKGASIVNAGRGAHLVEADLIPALDSGQLSTAVLDVFRAEPLPADHPFWGHERIVVTPHIGGATNPRTASRVVAENIRRLNAGEPLLNVVDPIRKY
jgi:glyoxylate/hydroxypyruvate reductase A